MLQEMSPRLLDNHLCEGINSSFSTLSYAILIETSGFHDDEEEPG
jgi:hypothetical protein